MKNKEITVYTSCFIYGLFSYAMVIPPRPHNLHYWLWQLAVSGAVNVMVAFLIMGKRKSLQTRAMLH